MKKKVVIYARFSSHTQTDQSIEGQLRECYSFAERNDYVVIKEYIDKALTGTTDKRPQFLQMVEDSKKRNFKYVIIYQLDRFARNRYDSANYKAKLKKNGVRVLSARENITDDASGILVEGLLESMAEYYSAELSQKVKRGIKESLMKGNFIGGFTLLGYDIIDKKWTINELEAEIVRSIFDKYYHGAKLIEIVEELKGRGVTMKSGKPFEIGKVARMIRNTKYMGKVVIDDVEYNNIVPAIIEQRIFERCNSIMDNYKHKIRRCESDHHYILSGKLFCGHCFSFMTAETGTSHTGKVHTYYKCYNRKKDINCCEKISVQKDFLEEFVMARTQKYISHPKVLDLVAKTIVDRFNAEISSNLVVISLEKQIEDVDRGINAIVDAIQKGITSKSTQERLIKLENDKEDLEEKLLTEKAHQLKPMDYNDVKNHLTKMVTKDYNNKQERYDFFNTYIKKVIITNEKILIIYNVGRDDEKSFKLPTNPDDWNEDDKITILKNKEELNTEENKKISSKLLKFKRDALGGEWGIWTLASFYTPTVLAGPPLRPLE